MCFVSDPLLADGQHGWSTDDKVGEIGYIACYCVSLMMLLLLCMHQINETIHYNV